MDVPTLPFFAGERGKAVLYSILLILWWAGVWGIADTIIHLVFKGHTMKELAVYIGLVSIVLVVVYMNPEFAHRM